MYNEPLIKQFPPYLKLTFLMLIVLVVLLITLIIGIVIAIPFFGTDILSRFMDISEGSIDENIPLQKYLQIISQLGTFIIPAILFAFLVHRKVWDYLKLNVTPHLLTVVLASMMIIMILPFISWLVEINELLQLPEFMAGIEQWMKNSEEQAMKLTEAFLNDTSVVGLIINLFMIAILAAVGEELLFRGVMLRLFKEWTGNNHLAVWISAILFSALHLQFFGFLPRMILGVVLGYLFIWSKSLWVPIFAHFVNNAAAVIVAYLYYKGDIKTDIESFGRTDNNILIIGSLIITIILLISIYRYEKSQSKTLHPLPPWGKGAGG